MRCRYEADYFWWELVEIARKLVLTLILVLFMEGSATQIVATLLVSFSSLLLLSAYRPYRADDDDSTAIVAQIGLVLTMFASLLMKLDVTGEDGWDKDVFDAILVLVLLSVPLFAFGEITREYLMISRRRRPACCARALKAAGSSASIAPRSSAQDTAYDATVAPNDVNAVAHLREQRKASMLKQSPRTAQNMANDDALLSSRQHGGALGNSSLVTVQRESWTLAPTAFEEHVHEIAAITNRRKSTLGTVLGQSAAALTPTHPDLAVSNASNVGGDREQRVQYMYEQRRKTAVGLAAVKATRKESATRKASHF